MTPTLDDLAQQVETIRAHRARLRAEATSQAVIRLNNNTPLVLLPADLDDRDADLTAAWEQAQHHGGAESYCEWVFDSCPCSDYLRAGAVDRPSVRPGDHVSDPTGVDYVGPDRACDGCGGGYGIAHDPDCPGDIFRGHVYTSTSCYHHQHQRCRLTCKFCGASCRCSCHPSRTLP